MKKILLFLIFFIGMILVGCNDSFFEKYFVISLMEENVFKLYDNFKVFMWLCYEMFFNMNIVIFIMVIGCNFYYMGDVYVGYLNQCGVSSQNKYVFQIVINVMLGNGWNFFIFICCINLMFLYVDDFDMIEVEKNYWKVVGYFFYLFWYMELIDCFGDVFWIDKLLDEIFEEVYGMWMFCLEVVDKVLECL